MIKTPDGFFGTKGDVFCMAGGTAIDVLAPYFLCLNELVAVLAEKNDSDDGVGCQSCR